MQLRKYKQDQELFHQGDKGKLAEEFFVIGEGEVEISVDTDGGKKFLCTKKAGDFFGEHVLNKADHERTATVTAAAPCTMLVLSRANWEKFKKSASEECLKQLTSIMGEGMVTCLKKIKFFDTIDGWKLELLANLFQYEVHQEGDVVFEEGDKERDLYVISQGSVAVTRNRGKDDSEVKETKSESKAAGDDRVHVTDLKSGDFFGELALVMDMPRSAAITCKEKCLLLKLSEKGFKNFLSIVPSFKETFQEIGKARTTQVFKKMKIPFFDAIPDNRMHELAQISTIKTYSPGDVVFSENDVGNSFYVNISGVLTVLKANEEGEAVAVGKILSGSYFGEIALVTNSPRTATIKCKTKCVLLSITKDNFEQFFQEDPTAYADFAIKLSRHDVPLLSVLVHDRGVQLFQKFVESEFSGENLKFWQECVRMEGLEEEKKGVDVKAEALKVYNTYVKEDADQCVNIPAKLRTEIDQSVAEGKFSLSMFKDAQNEVLKLMSSDSFNRFKDSDLFAQLLKAVGSYTDEEVVEEEDSDFELEIKDDSD